MDCLVIERNGSGYTVTRFRRYRGTISLAGGARAAGGTELAAAIRSFLPPLGDEPRIVFLLPPGQVFIREVDLPIRERRKVREVLSMELRGETALDADDLIFDAVPLAEGKTLAVWAKEKEVSHAIREGSEAGAEPESVTASMFSWKYIVPGEATTGYAALTDGAAVAVFRDGEPIFFRPLSRPEDLAATLAAVEIGRGIEVGKIYHFGELAVDPPSGLEGATYPLPAAGEFAASFGGDATAARLAAGAYAALLGHLSGEGVEFRAGKLACTRERDAFRKRLRVPLFLATLLALLLVGDAGLRYWLARKDIASLDASIGAIYREVFPGRKKGVDEPAELRGEIRKLTSTGTGGNVLAALNALAEAKGDDVTALLETEVDGTQLRVKGEARSVQGVTDFRNRLARHLASVEEGELKSRPDGSVSFTMRGTLKEGGK
jgi:general secretion pathway protein L